MIFDVAIQTPQIQEAIQGDTGRCTEFMSDALGMPKSVAKRVLLRAVFQNIDVTSPFGLTVELKGNDATLQERQLLKEYELPDHHEAEWLQRWWLGDR